MCFAQILPSREITTSPECRTAARTRPARRRDRAPAAPGSSSSSRATYGFSLACVSSTETPTTCSPALPYFFWNSTNHGISILQGPHHVAQKSSRTTLPLSDASFTSLPSTSFSVKFRFAGFAFAGHAAVGGGPGGASAAASTRSKCVSDETFSVNSASARQRSGGNHPSHVHSSSPQHGLVPSPSPQRRLNERGHALDLGARLARDQHEGAVADAPDRGLVAEHFDELFGRAPSSAA